MDSIKGFFKFDEYQTNYKIEINAGITTFLTMAYIIFVNPAILSKAGMPAEGVMTATILVSAISSILMGLSANLPFALAPGMGINAFVAFSMVIAHKMSWQTAMGAVFIAGIIFVIISLPKINLREKIVKAIPTPLRLGVASGIGLFIAFIGLSPSHSNIVVDNPATLVGFGGLSLSFCIFIIGLIATTAMLIKKVRGALIFGIVGTSIIALICSLVGMATGWLDTPFVKLPAAVFALPSMSVFAEMDIAGVFKIGMLAPLFTLIFTDMFDSISTFVGVSEVGGLIDENGNPRNIGRALLIDAFATTISGLFGTSSATTYIESASGIEEGGRTGLTAVVTGLCFIPFLFISPLLGFIPMVATGPVLVIVGIFMILSLRKIDWGNFEDSIPAFVSVITIPLTYSITQGIVLGFLTYILLKVILGKGREISATLWIIGLFSVISLILTMPK
ncbi:NCS2 family permease [Spirochaetota bacterium]